MKEENYRTTLVAAKLLGKDYIGIDISQDYVEYAKKRLESAEKERWKVLKEIEKHRAGLGFKNR